MDGDSFDGIAQSRSRPVDSQRRRSPAWASSSRERLIAHVVRTTPLTSPCLCFTERGSVSRRVSAALRAAYGASGENRDGDCATAGATASAQPNSSQTGYFEVTRKLKLGSLRTPTRDKSR